MTHRRGVKRLARELWPEIICAALLILIGMAGQKDDPLFAGFVVVMLGIGEAMGLRHRRLPLQATLEGVRQDVSAGPRDSHDRCRRCGRSGRGAGTSEPAGRPLARGEPDVSLAEPRPPPCRGEHFDGEARGDQRPAHRQVRGEPRLPCHAVMRGQQPGTAVVTSQAAQLGQPALERVPPFQQRCQAAPARVAEHLVKFGELPGEGGVLGCQARRVGQARRRVGGVVEPADYGAAGVGVEQGDGPAYRPAFPAHVRRPGGAPSGPQHVPAVGCAAQGDAGQEMLGAFACAG